MAKINSKSPKKREQDSKNSTSNIGSVTGKRTDFHEKNNGLNKIETDIFYASDEHDKRQQFLDSRNGVFEDQSKLYNCPKKSYLDCRKIGMILQNEVEIPEIPFIWWIIAIVLVIIGIYAHFEGPQYCLLLLIFGFIINTKKEGLNIKFVCLY